MGEIVAEMKFLELDVDELTLRVRVDDQLVSGGEAGEDHGYIRVAGDVRTVLLQ